MLTFHLRYLLILTLIKVPALRGETTPKVSEEDSYYSDSYDNETEVESFQETEDLTIAMSPKSKRRTKDPEKLYLEWPKDTSMFDFVGMIAINKFTLGPCVLISARYGVTSANFMYKFGAKVGRNDVEYYKRPWWERLSKDTYDKTRTKAQQLTLYFIDGAYNKNVARRITDIFYQYHRLQTKRKPIDSTNQYDPNHDFAIVKFPDTPPTVRESRMRFWKDFNQGKNVLILPGGTLRIGAFGYIDPLHVKQNYQLEIVEYPVEEVKVDCDYWVPRNWGHFICVLNIERLTGVQPGSALTYNGIFVGVGSFSLMRGKEEVLVFTDIRKYHDFYWTPDGVYYEDCTIHWFGFKLDEKDKPKPWILP